MPNRDHRAELDRLLQMTAERPTPPKAPRDWFRVENAASPSAEVYIYDTIGAAPWGEGVGARDFVQALAKISAREITVHLNSPGGDVFEGVAIFNSLRSHPATVTVRVEGIAASAASFIAMAGDQIIMAPHSTMMIHETRGVVFGTADEIRARAEVLDKLNGTVAAMYHERAGGSLRDWLNAMHEETWYSDQQAVDAGLADAIDGQPAVQNHFDLSLYAHAPAHLAPSADAATRTPTERDAERALRDAGLSARAAKAVLARGWSDPEPRDEVTERLLAGLVALRH